MLPANQVYAEVRIEEGSRRIWTYVRGAAELLIAFGGIRAGIDYLVHDGKRTAGIINESILRDVFGGRVKPLRRERRTGTPGELKRLFDRVHDGQLSPQAAAREAEEMLRKANVPEELIRQVIREMPLEASQALPPRAPRPRMPRWHETVAHSARGVRGVFVHRRRDGTLVVETY